MSTTALAGYWAVALLCSLLTGLLLRYRVRIIRFEIERSQRAAEEFPILSVFRMPRHMAEWAVPLRVHFLLLILVFWLVFSWAAVVAGTADRIYLAWYGHISPDRTAAADTPTSAALIALGVLSCLATALTLAMRGRLVRYIATSWAVAAERSTDSSDTRLAERWVAVAVVSGFALGLVIIVLALRARLLL